MFKYLLLCYKKNLLLHFVRNWMLNPFSTVMQPYEAKANFTLFLKPPSSQPALFVSLFFFLCCVSLNSRLEVSSVLWYYTYWLLNI